jgi:hypothetical protein
MLAKVQPLIFERVANVLPGTADFNEDLLTSLLRQPHWPQLYRSIFSEGLSLDGADHACCRFVAIVEPPSRVTLPRTLPKQNTLSLPYI